MRLHCYHTETLLIQMLQGSIFTVVWKDCCLICIHMQMQRVHYPWKAPVTWLVQEPLPVYVLISPFRSLKLVQASEAGHGLVTRGAPFTQHQTVPGPLTTRADHLLSLPQKEPPLNHSSVLRQLCKHHPVVHQQKSGAPPLI